MEDQKVRVRWWKDITEAWEDLAPTVRQMAVGGAKGVGLAIAALALVFTAEGRRTIRLIREGASLSIQEAVGQIGRIFRVSQFETMIFIPANMVVLPLITILIAMTAGDKVRIIWCTCILLFSGWWAFSFWVRRWALVSVIALLSGIKGRKVVEGAVTEEQKGILRDSVSWLEGFIGGGTDNIVPFIQYYSAAYWGILAQYLVFYTFIMVSQLRYVPSPWQLVGIPMVLILVLIENAVKHRNKRDDTRAQRYSPTGSAIPSQYMEVVRWICVVYLVGFLLPIGWVNWSAQPAKPTKAAATTYTNADRLGDWTRHVTRSDRVKIASATLSPSSRDSTSASMAAARDFIETRPWYGFNKYTYRVLQASNNAWILFAAIGVVLVAFVLMLRRTIGLPWLAFAIMGGAWAVWMQHWLPFAAVVLVLAFAIMGGHNRRRATA